MSEENEQVRGGGRVLRSVFFFFGGNYEISREVGGKLAPFESIRFFEEVVTMLNRGYELHLI